MSNVACTRVCVHMYHVSCYISSVTSTSSTAVAFAKAQRTATTHWR